MVPDWMWGMAGGHTVPNYIWIFIHDLISEVKQLGYGVEFNDEKLSILVNADNIAVLGKTEVDLHNILDLEI